MALRALMLRRSIEDKRKELENLRENDAQWQDREAQLERAIEEAETAEEKQAVEEAVNQFDADQKSHEEAKANLANEIAGLERDLEEAERAKPNFATAPSQKQQKQERRNDMTVQIRSLPKGQRAFDSLPLEQREAIVKQQEVQEFLTRMRSMKGQQRSITGGELIIPVVFLDLIAENMYRYSKLINRVRVRNVNGQARQTIAGTVPEAVWTEMCGALNELTFQFNQVTLDGYKVAGYIPVCNSLLEDTDINLASWIVEMLSESIGLAMDKAILYGSGAASHMPLGIVTRLAQDSAPSGYPSTAPAWQDLSDSNLIQLNTSGMTVEQFWAAFMVAAGNTSTLYSRGRMFWAMNSKTYWKIRSMLVRFNMEGYPVANMPGVMPFTEGDVDILEFIPDGDIIGGYGDLYLLAIRGGMTIEASTEAMFIQDNTVFRGKERADGMPVIPGAFVVININNAPPTTTMTFAGDTANDAQLIGLTIGSETLSPVFSSSTYSYTVTASAATDAVTATPAQPGSLVAISYNGKNVKNGGSITWETATLPLTISVTMGNKTRVYTVSVTKS